MTIKQRHKIHAERKRQTLTDSRWSRDHREEEEQEQEDANRSDLVIKIPRGEKTGVKRRKRLCKSGSEE